MFNRPSFKTLLAAMLCLTGLTLVGCKAERAVVAPAEPDWSYRDGNTQLSNNDTWERLIPGSPILSGKAQVASVEQSTAE